MSWLTRWRADRRRRELLARWTPPPHVAQQMAERAARSQGRQKSVVIVLNVAGVIWFLVVAARELLDHFK